MVCVSLLCGGFATAFGLETVLALLAHLFLSQLLLGDVFLFVSPSLRVILFDNDTVLKLLALEVVQVLSLDDILEASFVTIALELAQQVKLVALKLLDTLIEC